jgi:hypothetical protein
MQRPDQTEITTEQATQSTPPVSLASSSLSERGFDWPALGVVILIAALFAIVARFNAQPATSLVPAAVLSASGCGLLVTALRKLRTVRRPGLLEAGLGGLFLALFQFVAAITYPGVVDILGTDPIQRQAFLTTWELIAGFSIIFSMIGAVLGHLAFAPPRPLPAKSRPIDDEENATGEEQQVDSADQEMEVSPAGDEHEGNNTQIRLSTTDTSDTIPISPPRTIFSYVVTILLLGLAPTVIGYVFSAAYDYSLSLNQLLPGPLPTLRLLSALLPWQLPVHINLIPSNAGFIIFTLLWRIPFSFGNPTIFDFQALEPLVFNGAALGLLFLTMYRRDTSSSEPSTSLSWRLFLVFEILLGLVLVFPSNLWALHGLHGLLQIQNLAIPIPGIQILNPATFVLNLFTGPLVCLVIGMLLYWQYRKGIKTR